MEPIKTEPMPVSDTNCYAKCSNILANKTIGAKIEIYEKFSLCDDIVCSALKALAEKMKLQFLFSDGIQNERFEVN